MTVSPRLSLSKNLIYAIIFSIVLCIALLFVIFSRVASAATSTNRSSQHILSIHDGGNERGVITEAKTLREAFKKANITLEKHDITEPSLDEELISGTYEVNIYRARPVIIKDGIETHKILTPYRTPKQIAKDANIDLRNEDKVKLSRSSNILSDGASEIMSIDRALSFTFVFYGKTETAFTHATNVGQMLKDKNIKLGPNDTLSIPESTPMAEGMKVELWRNGKQTITEDLDVDFPIEQIKDANREASYKEIKTAGAKGKRTVTYEVVMKNGVEESRKEIQSITIKEPQKQVEIVGAKFNYTGGPLSDAQINALGTCESGMTATRNSGNGFYGAFQFMPGTWRTVAPAPYNTMMPHEAPLDAQKQAVQNLLSRSSIYTQFPGCAKKMQASGVI